MNKKKLVRLRRLQSEADHLRKELRVSVPGQIIYRRDLNPWSNVEVLVEADGLGRAKVRVINGNFPIDYTEHWEKVFGTEDAACDAADEVTEIENPSVV